MATTLRHQKISGKASGSDATQVQGAADWDVDHVIGGAVADRQALLSKAAVTPKADWTWLASSDVYDNLTNSTGGGLVLGDVVAVSTGVATLDDTLASINVYAVCAETTLANTVAGRFNGAGVIAQVNVTGALTAGHYVVKSATAKAVQDSGVVCGGATVPPTGALGVAMGALGGSGLAPILWWRNASAAAISTAMPTGTLALWSGPAASPPSGWLAWDGSAVSRTTYSGLFSVFGTTYGVGDGSTTFNLGNGKGRVLVGYDVTVTQFNSLGKTGGAVTHALTTAELAAHSHTTTLEAGSNTGAQQAWVFGANTDNGPASTGITNGTTGSGTAHENCQPYLTVGGYIVKT